MSSLFIVTNIGVCHVITIYSNKNMAMSSLYIVTARTLGVIKCEPRGMSFLYIVNCCQKYKSNVCLVQTVLPNDVRVHRSLMTSWARTPPSYTTDSSDEKEPERPVWPPRRPHFKLDDGDYEQEEETEIQPVRRRKNARLRANPFIDSEAGLNGNARNDDNTDGENDDRRLYSSR